MALIKENTLAITADNDFGIPAIGDPVDPTTCNLNDSGAQPSIILLDLKNPLIAPPNGMGHWVPAGPDKDDPWPAGEE
jgi:hypothetical protein